MTRVNDRFISEENRLGSKTTKPLGCSAFTTLLCSSPVSCSPFLTLLLYFRREFLLVLFLSLFLLYRMRGNCVLIG